MAYGMKKTKKVVRKPKVRKKAGKKPVRKVKVKKVKY